MNIYTPYTYLIGWSTHNVWYYGRRTGKNCNPSDLWTTYFTSSKYVKQFRQQYGEPDVIQIRKTFSSKTQCCVWEEKVLQRISAATNSKFLNKRNGNSSWDTSGIAPANKGKPRDLTTKQKISKTLSGRTLTDTHKENVGLALKGRVSPTKGKPGWSRGKQLSEEHKQRIREGMLAKHQSRKLSV